MLVAHTLQWTSSGRDGSLGNAVPERRIGDARETGRGARRPTTRYRALRRRERSD